LAQVLAQKLPLSFFPPAQTEGKSRLRCDVARLGL
jgi:hypothetical protein